MELIKYQKIFILYIINKFISNYMNNNIYQELIKNQRKNLISDKKLSLSDLKRIASYLNTSIFSNDCSFWSGYVTEIKSGLQDDSESKSSSFVNFFFNGKKQALHRILYYNFIGDLFDNEYLKFNCNKKGHCCTLSHIMKISNDKILLINIDKKESKKKKDITVEF